MKYSNQSKAIKRSSKRISSRRPGFALFNAVSLMATVGLLMSLSAIVLQRAGQTHRKTIEHLRLIQNLSSAADRFRADAHRSEHVDVERSMQFRIDDNTIEYSVDDNVFKRSVIVDQTESSIETWVLPASCRVSWSVDRSGHKPLAIGTFEFESLPEPGSIASPSSTGFEPLQWKARVGVYGSILSDRSSAEVEQTDVSGQGLGSQGLGSQGLGSRGLGSRGDVIEAQGGTR